MIKALEKAKKKFERQQTSKHREKEVKQAVKEIINEMDPTADIFMPVQGGYGAVDLDFICCVNGFYLSIETKANGKEPTYRQLGTMQKKVKAGGVGLFLDQDNLEDLVTVISWLLVKEIKFARRFSEDSRERYLNR